MSTSGVIDCKEQIRIPKFQKPWSVLIWKLESKIFICEEKWGLKFSSIFVKKIILFQFTVREMVGACEEILARNAEECEMALSKTIGDPAKFDLEQFSNKYSTDGVKYKSETQSK